MGSEASTAFAHYEDLDPPFEWVRGDSLDAVVINLPGFEKQHLKVQTDSRGNVRTSGERLEDGNRWIRFWKDFRVPENCNVKDVRAKFENQKLHVLFPKSVADAEALKAPVPVPTPAAPPQRAAADDDKTQQQKANGKSTEPVIRRRDLDQREEEKEERLKPKEEDAAEKKAARTPRKDIYERDDKNLQQSKEKVDKPSGAEKKTAPAPEPSVSLEPKTDGKSSDEKKMVPPPAAMTSKPGDGGVEGVTERQGMLGIDMGGLTQARKGLLLNVAVATLVLLALAFYLKHKLTKAETK